MLWGEPEQSGRKLPTVSVPEMGTAEVALDGWLRVSALVTAVVGDGVKSVIRTFYFRLLLPDGRGYWSYRRDGKKAIPASAHIIFG